MLLLPAGCIGVRDALSVDRVQEQLLDALRMCVQLHARPDANIFAKLLMKVSIPSVDVCVYNMCCRCPTCVRRMCVHEARRITNNTTSRQRPPTRRALFAHAQLLTMNAIRSQSPSLKYSLALCYWFYLLDTGSVLIYCRIFMAYLMPNGENHIL
jgi:hypothetical protein